jgi:sulfopyruvate decarboxylase subunit beta
LSRVFGFDSISGLEQGFDAVVTANAPGHTFVILKVEAFSPAEQQLPQPPFDGPELKYRFGRHLEKLTGADVFGYRF